jgi:mono/diheme cytochrome c family protein
MKKIALGLLSTILIILLGLLGYVLTTWDKKHDAPLPDIKASSDSAVIARGKYLAFGPAHCAQCHIPDGKHAEVDKGAEIPLSGGFELAIDPGTFRAPNLTPDNETGIGKYTDGELARALRHSVKKDGSALFPIMPFQEISDEDLTAIISFLRSQPAVKNEVKPSELNFLGKALTAFGLLKPVGPTKTPPKSVSIDSTAEYGSYLANSVANCRGCHTNRDLKTGDFIGKPYAGGFMMPADKLSKGYTFVTPNLTPEKTTGLIANWTEDAFIKRFKAGRSYEGSHMPWGTFSRMDELELKALYRYLRTLPPVVNKIDKIAFAPGEKLPK